MRKLISEEALRKFIISELDGDRDLFERLRGHLIKHFAELESVESDSKKAKLVAHRLRSGCNSFGAYELANILERLEYCKIASEHSELFETALKLIEPTMKAIARIADKTFGEIKKSA